MYVEQLSATQALRPVQLDALAALLQDAVEGGASVGFLAPLSGRTARGYWRGVMAALGEELSLWLAYEGEHIVGAVQLAQCSKANGRHRGEVQKLFVLRTHRGRGIARALLEAVERHAQQQRMHLLVLDTEAGSAAEQLYRHLGWQPAGMIPDFALSPDGRLHATMYFYKTLSTRNPKATKLAKTQASAGPMHPVMV